MTRWIVMIGFLEVLAGCSSDADGGSCAASIPASCPSVMPSYKSDVAPLLKTYCLTCHQAGGEQAMKPLDTYSGVTALKDDVKGEIGGCDMPPSGKTQPTTAERDKVLAWLTCGAPDN